MIKTFKKIIDFFEQKNIGINLIFKIYKFDDLFTTSHILKSEFKLKTSFYLNILGLNIIIT